MPRNLSRHTGEGRETAKASLQARTCRLLAWQKDFTRSGPKVTSPGPRGEGCTPSMPSLVVGSLQRRSMSTMPPSSMVSGRCSSSIWSIRSMDRPMPACTSPINGRLRIDKKPAGWSPLLLEQLSKSVSRLHRSQRTVVVSETHTRTDQIAQHT